jgi:hypothetical protein
VTRTANLVFPRVAPTADELSSGSPDRTTLKAAIQLLQAHGCLQLDGVFRADLIHRLRRAYLKRYKRYFVDMNHADALRVGLKRYQITVDVEAPFHTPALYANPFVFPVLEGVLGQSVVLNSFGSVVSLPGAAHQNTHRDHPPLFDEHAADLFAPPFAITVIVPLVGLDETTGTTQMLPGSHVLFDDKGNARPPIDPIVPVGSCLLMDYRLIHKGTENRSDRVRPIFYIVYSRPWFRDSVNFYRQDPIVMRRAQLERTPKQWRRLFALAKIVDPE